MALSYGNVDDVKRLLQVDKEKIKVGDAVEDDISEADFQSFVQDEEDRFVGLLGTRTATASVGKYIVNHKAACAIYRSLYLRSGGALPETLQKWEDDSDALLEAVQSGKGESVGGFGDWSVSV
jgi:hypothetical protein